MHAFEPQSFGEYILHDRIGAGGMAEIFLATAQGIEGFEKRLVIKRILPTLSDDEQFVRMFIEEAKLCVALRHPNIVQVYDLGEIDLQYFIAMEYVDGRDLLKTLAACGRKKIGFPTDIALYIVMEVLKGLDYAHKLSGPDGSALGIIHRDVSPSNVLLSFEGEVKIGDFGIAKASTREKTATGILKGKFGYMAPEQVTGAPIDHKADIFAVGIVLYELLTGHRLFAGKNDLAVLERVRDAVIDPPPRFYRSDLDPELERIVMRALSRDAADRFDDATELHDALHDYVYRSRALIGPAHLGRFMQTLFLSDPEELVHRNRIALPLFGHEAPPEPSAIDAMPSFGPEATEDDRGRTFDDAGSYRGDFDEKTPLADAADLPYDSSLSSQVALIEDASSFERDFDELDVARNVREPSSPTQSDPTVDPQSLDVGGTADTKRKSGVVRTARTDLSEPVVQVHDDDIDGVVDNHRADAEDDYDDPTEAELDPPASQDRTASALIPMNGEDRTDSGLSDEVRALRAQREEDAATDYELDKDPGYAKAVSRRARSGSGIATELTDDDEIQRALSTEGASSARAFSPAEIVERTVSALEAEEPVTSSEVEPTVRFDSSILSANGLSSQSTRVPMPEPLENSHPSLTDEYPEFDIPPCDLPTAEVDERSLELLEEDEQTSTNQRAPSLTAPALESPSLDTLDPIVQPVESSEAAPPEDDTDIEPVDESELTAELEEEVRLALANDSDRKPRLPRPRSMSGRRPRPVLLPSEDGRDNLARRPSTHSVMPRRASPRRRLDTRAPLSVVNPRHGSMRRRASTIDPAEQTGPGMLVDESTRSGALADETKPDPINGALPHRRQSSGITAAVDEAQQIADEIAQIRRTSSVATHEPTALGMLADALDGSVNLPEPEIDFDPEEPTQDGSHLQKAILRRQSRRRMVTRSVVLYSEDDKPNPTFGAEFDGSELSAPAITSAGQLEDPDAVDLFGALSVLDDHSDELDFGEDDVSYETMSRAEARPQVDIDERQAIPVPPTAPNPIPMSRGVSLVDQESFGDGGPATTKGSVIPDDEDENEGFELSFGEHEEETAPVTDNQVVSISRLIGIPSDAAEPDVVELGGHDSLDEPNPSSVSLSFGSMSVSISAIEDEEDDGDEFTTVNEEEGRHVEEIRSLRSGPLDIADEPTAGGQSSLMPGPDGIADLPTDDRGGLLVSESFDFGVARQEELRGVRPEPTDPPPPVRPVSMVATPGGVETDEAHEDEIGVRPARRPNNASALRAVVERHKRPVREKNLSPPSPMREPNRALNAPLSPMGTPVRQMGTPGVRATGTAPPHAARGSLDGHPPVAEVQIRRVSFWTTLMYLMVGIAVVLAVAAAVSTILLKNRGTVPIAPLQPNEQGDGLAAAPPNDEAPEEAVGGSAEAPPGGEADDTEKTAARTPEPAEETPVEAATTPEPPPPAAAPEPPVKKRRAVRRAPKRTTTKKAAPRRAPKKRKAASTAARIEIACAEPTTIRIYKVGTFENRTSFSKSLEPGAYQVAFVRDGKTVRSTVTVVAGQTLEMRCP